jgi:hypothetical protein
VIADDAEVLPLRIDHRLVVKRSVSEAEDQARRDAITLDVLNEIAVRERLALKRLQHQESVHQPFRVTHRYCLLR